MIYYIAQRQILSGKLKDRDTFGGYGGLQDCISPNGRDYINAKGGGGGGGRKRKTSRGDKLGGGRRKEKRKKADNKIDIMKTIRATYVAKHVLYMQAKVREWGEL